MMLQVDIEQRFSALQVLEHPWVNVSKGCYWFYFSHTEVLLHYLSNQLECCFGTMKF